MALHSFLNSKTIVGSFVKIERGSKIHSITLKLAHSSAITDIGRCVGLAYWIRNAEFDSTNLGLNVNSTTPSLQPCWFSRISDVGSLVTIRYKDGKQFSYYNTNKIPINTAKNVTFYFDDAKEIDAKEIFVALISTRDQKASEYDDVKNSALSLELKTSGTLYFKNTNVDSIDKLTPQAGMSLNIISMDVESIGSNNNTGNKPSPIKCKELKYRTWSNPLWSNIKPSEKNFKIGTKSHQLSYADGGEQCGYLYNTTNRPTLSKKTISFNGNIFKPYIINDNSTFESEFNLPEGRLSDVIFSQPNEVGEIIGNTIKPRWCFKRSRIMFTIPGIKNLKKGIVIKYIVKTPVFDKNSYSIKPKTCFYTNTQAQNDINIVICPRDEGVLDNMPFEVIFSRSYANSASSLTGQWSTETSYKFHTFQKPTVNITYPKVIRNDSTWGNDSTRGFKFAKIPTSNIYSCFDGEWGIKNKYVCDALNVLFSTPKNDDSGIPMFVRFYVAEFKFGRDGCLGENEFKSTQDLFKSTKETVGNTSNSIYTSLNDILTGKVYTEHEDNLTAYMTNIFSNDDSPILLSGRFNKDTLKTIGEQYNLWTYSTWDYVVDDDEKDVKVYNAWDITVNKYDENGNKINKIISKPIVGDHKGKPVLIDADTETCSYPVSKMLLFRAGYCYLIRIRMFHGAAAGAIGRKYGKLNEVTLGKEGTGFYNYAGDDSYGSTYPLNDGSKHGNEKPYNGWLGPEDGTSGLYLKDDNLNETYAGFSEVDYSIFEAVCPYTSTSNLITVHPTSPQISINQCLSFNYRHLSKNIGGIDNYVWNPNTLSLENEKFGKTFSGIQNTVTRIMSMYSSCVEEILNRYFKMRTSNASDFYTPEKMGVSACNTCEYKITHEKLLLKIKPINSVGRQMSKNQLEYTQSTPKSINIPLINNFDLIEKNCNSFNDMGIKGFYTDLQTSPFIDNGINYNCGCDAYNKYRIKLRDKEIEKLEPDNINFVSEYKDQRWQWPELNIIYKKVVSGQTGSITEEPLGNVYRWQPVINAVTVNNNKIEEIKIQNDKDNIKTVNNNKLMQPNSISSNTGTMRCSNLIYGNEAEDSFDGDIQKDYFYEDINVIISNNTNMSNNSSNRFTINEFAGFTTGNTEGSGYPVMHTLPSRKAGQYGPLKSLKYFSNINQSTQLKEYGKLYTRVPITQDCENGIITTGTINFGSLTRSKDSKGLYVLDNNGNNYIPLVRTTHYLYFKTHINTAFTLQVSVEAQYVTGCEDQITESGTIHIPGETKSSSPKTFYFNSKGDDVNTLDEKYNIILFGNTDGISEVYAEDNNGWGRCLSADDISAKKLRSDGALYDNINNNNKIIDNNISGGIEVPILVRYTPLLQPKLINETIINKINKNEKEYTIEPCSKNIIIEEDNYGNASNILFTYDGTTQMRSNKLTLNICYPFIPENETYTTRHTNGGNNNVWFENYNIDNDTDVPDNRNLSIEPTNMDFMGGYGICTGYTVLLVPSDPDLNALKNVKYIGYGNNKCLIDSEIQNYFNCTDGHWNYFKQPANYYRTGHIYNLRSKTQTNAGPVLVAYNVQLDNTKKQEYLEDGIDKDGIKGRNFKSIDLDINKLRKGEVYYKDKWVTLSDFNRKDEAKKYNISLNPKANKLNTGLIYDLVIVPVYTNAASNVYDWTKDKAGTINTNSYGHAKDSDENDIRTNLPVHFAGSNPSVSFNYLQIAANIINPNPGGEIINPPDPEDPKDVSKIHNTSHAIIFPNVDHELFNMSNTNSVQESPGFWLNNSFRLVLRLPSYRTKNTKIEDNDVYTIENMSNGYLDSDNGDTANDFKFSDIQIHIGKIEELKKYGYPDNLYTNLNMITDKDELAQAHIISYNDYKDADVFSKKLNEDIVNDLRDIATAGALDPTNENYKNRFIEVNLTNVTIKAKDGVTNVPIYTAYPEGFYIQFRVKPAYSSGTESQQWTDWVGGSCDGGLHWWGDNGLQYYVPVRNYSEIFTDFRNYVKESFPGSNELYGKGSLLDYAETNDNSNNNPKDAIQSTYYMNGLGNMIDSKMIVGSDSISSGECYKYELKSQGNEWIYDKITIDLSKNTDWPYKDEEQYRTSHSTSDQKSPLNTTLPSNRLWEMLYIDFIIRNMSKLYYKPKYNDTNNYWNGKNSATNNLKYHLSVPYENNKPIILDKRNWAWDDTEYHLFNTATDIKNNKGLSNEKEYNEKSFKDNDGNIIDPINHNRSKFTGNLNKWNVNKYYRRPITKNDFDELQQHLTNLLNFIRNSNLTGMNDINKDDTNHGIGKILPIDPTQLDFNKTRKGIIGHDIDETSGIENINNINHTMMSSNYIQNIWNNIKLTCDTSNDKKINK